MNRARSKRIVPQREMNRQDAKNRLTATRWPEDSPEILASLASLAVRPYPPTHPETEPAAA
jgi:hypothetical protein